MSVDFKNLRVPADYPVYPPYHKGDYLEEYFYKFYIKNKLEFDKTGYTLIPIFWTNVYITNKNRELLQPYINCLPTDKKYFTVSQHDDAVQESLPSNTLSFEAGGNKNGIPLPLICSPLEKSLIKKTDKDIFCSFVGSISHNATCRVKLYEQYSNNTNFYFSTARLWTPHVPDDKFKEFIDITQRSEFALCPRGYGKQSFRIYEVMQLNSIPVIIYNDKWFPFSDTIDWDTFTVCIHENNIHQMYDILKSYSNEQKVELLKNGARIYKEYFTLEQTSKNILIYLQKYYANIKRT
jgi:hypothetical protein